VINDDELILPVVGSKPALDADVVMERSVSAARGIYALRILEARGYRTVNRYATAATCWIS